VWVGPLTSNAYAVILFNRDQTAATITANWSDLGISGNYSVRDLWLHAEQGVFTGSYSANVTIHGVVMVKLTPA